MAGRPAAHEPATSGCSTGCSRSRSPPRSPPAFCSAGRSGQAPRSCAPGTSSPASPRLALLGFHLLSLAVRGYVESRGLGRLPAALGGGDVAAAVAELRCVLGPRAAARPEAGEYRVSQKALYWWTLAALALLGGTGLGVGFWSGSARSRRCRTLAALHRGLRCCCSPPCLWHLYGVLAWEGRWSPEWSWLTGRSTPEKARRKVPGAWRRHLPRRPSGTPRPGWAPPSEQARGQQAQEKEEVQAELEKGNRLALEERYVEALYHYRRALELYPGYSQARYNMARVLARMGEREMAGEAYRQFLDADPFHPLARKAQEALRELESGGAAVSRAGWRGSAGGLHALRRARRAARCALRCPRRPPRRPRPQSSRPLEQGMPPPRGCTRRPRPAPAGSAAFCAAVPPGAAAPGPGVAVALHNEHASRMDCLLCHWSAAARRPAGAVLAGPRGRPGVPRGLAPGAARRGRSSSGPALRGRRPDGAASSAARGASAATAPAGSPPWRAPAPRRDGWPALERLENYFTLAPGREVVLPAAAVSAGSRAAAAATCAAGGRLALLAGIAGLLPRGGGRRPPPAASPRGRSSRPARPATSPSASPPTSSSPATASWCSTTSTGASPCSTCRGGASARSRCPGGDGGSGSASVSAAPTRSSSLPRATGASSSST